MYFFTNLLIDDIKITLLIISIIMTFSFPPPLTFEEKFNLLENDQQRLFVQGIRDKLEAFLDSLANNTKITKRLTPSYSTTSGPDWGRLETDPEIIEAQNVIRIAFQELIQKIITYFDENPSITPHDGLRALALMIHEGITPGRYETNWVDKTRHDWFYQLVEDRRKPNQQSPT